ncbi:hypothetical protein LWI28_027960 [Acer negundo]|uniref:Uncharacterized protein n=1 Tax=Acer negundo TaxID=4023 RepID=A0AAD5IHM5_ACENE|nr:hypothetical protein LWI28_027960 [Acer negundo]
MTNGDLVNGQWNLEEEVVKIIEVGKALGFDFNSREDKVAVFMVRREEEYDDISKVKAPRYPAATSGYPTTMFGYLTTLSEYTTITSIRTPYYYS